MVFTDKVILITGGSVGIGAACAEYFAIEGALLALVGRNAEKFESVLEKIKGNGVEIEPLIIVADVSADAERIVNETIERYGRLDILINNAGFGVFEPFENMKMETYDAIMATNVRGAVELTKLACPYLIESQGNIINISSGLSMIAFPNGIAYAISKAMLDQFTKCLAMELAPKGVRVNSVNPGAIDTDFHVTAGITPDDYVQMREFYNKLHPLQRMGNTDDCVNAIAFLAEDSTNFVTGFILPVDGGQTVKGPF